MTTNANHLSQQQFKIVLLGEGCVGKTSLMLRYCHNKFNEAHESTLQASFLTKKFLLNETRIQLFIWDTAGQERFHALGPIYYRDSNGALLVYDVTDSDSLSKVKSWVKELRKIRGNNVVLTIVGNKIDLLSLEQQNNFANNELIAEAMKYSQSVNATHYCTSAKKNRGIDDLFLDLTKKMMAKSQSSQEQTQFKSRSTMSGSGQRGLVIADEPTNNEDSCENRRNKCC
ncbi:ras-related protein Rab-21-like [Oppia nitens]|uniref:ras-related protein Rab-21-like n=1 Tax=Oppia nitens TaxID=1686743 RepID=UPI0023DA0E09|nr:ras-related protein Rab-21-like [Oppia nitens]